MPLTKSKKRVLLHPWLTPYMNFPFQHMGLSLNYITESISGFPSYQWWPLGTFWIVGLRTLSASCCSHSWWAHPNHVFGNLLLN